MTSLSGSGNPEDLSCRRHSGKTLGRGVLKHGRHTLGHGSPRDHGRIGSRVDQPSHVFGYFEDLKHTSTTAVTGTIATLASLRLVHAITHLQPKHGVARVSGELFGRK